MNFTYYIRERAEVFEAGHGKHFNCNLNKYSM